MKNNVFLSVTSNTKTQYTHVVVFITRINLSIYGAQSSFSAELGNSIKRQNRLFMSEQCFLPHFKDCYVWNTTNTTVDRDSSKVNVRADEYDKTKHTLKYC